MIERTLPTRQPIDLRLTFGGAARPHTTLVRPDGVWRATRTPMGTATIRLTASKTAVRGQAWGDGAEWLLEHLGDAVGASDDVEGFDPGSGLVGSLAHRFPGLRIPRTRAVFDMLLPVILEQKVIGKEARRSYAGIVRRYGSPASGPVGAIPAGLRVAPDPTTLARLPDYAFHPHGVERKRSDTIRRAAALAPSLEATSTVDLATAHRRLQADSRYRPLDLGRGGRRRPR